MPGHAGKPADSAADLARRCTRARAARSSRARSGTSITSIGSLARRALPERAAWTACSRATSATRVLDQALTDGDRHLLRHRGARAVLLQSTDAKLPDKKRNYLMREAARATSAAPTYFEPDPCSRSTTQVDHRPLVDGGVFANNPAMCAVGRGACGGATARGRAPAVARHGPARPADAVLRGARLGPGPVGAADPQRRHRRRQRRRQLPAARDARRSTRVPAPDARARGRQRRHGRRRKDKPPRALGPSPSGSSTSRPELDAFLEKL